MKTSELKSSKYLKKEDCGDDGILVTIAGLKKENMAPDDKPEELKWILYFQGDVKPLALNSTNINRIETALGDETDNWIGKAIVLFNDENVEYKGETIGGVRVDVNRTKRYHAKNEKAPAAKSSKPAHIEDMESDVPF